MSPVDEEITALVLTTATHPVPQVRTAAGALIGRIQAEGPIRRHLEASLRRLSRDFGWDVAQEARFLVTDLKLTRPRGGGTDEAKLLRSLAAPVARRRRAA
jgi:hypothetical protein